MEQTTVNYNKIISSGIRITMMQPEHADQLEALQHLVFPNLAEEEIFHAPQYLKHLEIFPEAQFVALDNDKVVGATTSMRYHFDVNDQSHHTFFEIMGGGWLTTHNPHGEWLYGLDLGVDPAYRSKGIAKELYRARHHACKALGLKGQITVGMLNGYNAVKDKMGIDEYYNKVKQGELFDPTVSVQQKIGFKITGLMKDYLNDPTCGNAGAVIVLEVEKDI